MDQTADSSRIECTFGNFVLLTVRFSYHPAVSLLKVKQFFFPTGVFFYLFSKKAPWRIVTLQM